MSLINQCSGTYTPEGIDLDFALQVPEEHRVYKDPEFYNNITYCDKLNLSGWSFTTEPTLNIHDFYVYMAAMPLWEEYESRMHRAGLSKTTRSLGANNNYAFYASDTEVGFRMDERYYFTGRKLLDANLNTNISGGVTSWKGMNSTTTKSLITGLEKGGIISFNNQESIHGDKAKHNLSDFIIGNDHEQDLTKDKGQLSMDKDGKTYFIHVEKDKR
jgi:hypothetical protein